MGHGKKGKGRKALEKQRPQQKKPEGSKAPITLGPDTTTETMSDTDPLAEMIKRIKLQKGKGLDKPDKEHEPLKKFPQPTPIPRPSVVRDLPFGCGHNTPILTKEAIVEYDHVHVAIFVNT